MPRMAQEDRNDNAWYVILATLVIEAFWIMGWGALFSLVVGVLIGQTLAYRHMRA